MPIPILSLPAKDIQYALNCMDTCDLLAFSLCSKRTKNLAKSSNRKIDPISVEAYDNSIRFIIYSWGLSQPINFMTSSDSRIQLDRGNGIEFWRKRKFTQSDWIAHFLSIFNESMIDQLGINNVCPISNLDNVKQIIPKCQALRIFEPCSTKLAKAAILKLAPIVEEVEVYTNHVINDISLFLSCNLKALVISDWINPLKLELSDLLVLNVIDLTLETANITDKELNRFLKIWMKGNHRFYRPKNITLKLSRRMQVNREEVFKGIQYRTVDDNYRLKRADGKELLVLVCRVAFEFRVTFEFR
ncbi:hypothetical protein B9Z55_021597 [Caenorhabditis nigoni]|uniref:F-box domain-containing protein n=1 Tax=Caenorhabditis nigoni TaxID=1611254 RepID=A0A2G5TSU3_9PELO|nr:hypothetical protein B9Z55_021597 [Caenorhabditis nigoni]